MKIHTYDTMTYEEDERINNSVAYAHNGKGNRKCQHIRIFQENQVKYFLEKFGLSGINDEQISLSILWNLPRKQYNETKMWVCLSGFTYNNNDFRPKNFVISDNIVKEESQEIAKEIIDLLNTWDGIEVSYPEDII